MQPPTPVELETLTHVHQFLRAGHGRNMLVAVDDDFVASLADADAPVAGNALLSKLNHLSAHEAAVAPAKSVIKRVAEVVPDSHDGEFMAPMCCPLTKTCMKQIADPANDYLVTEKSDGVRTVLYSEAVHNYPRWVRVDETAAAARIATEPLGLIDQAMLEGAWRELISDNAAFKAGLHLTVGTGKMTPVPPSESNGNDIVVLRMMPNGSSELVDVRFKRVKEPRHFTFVFDRSMGATYLMLEETPFPTTVTRIVLDGELILSYPPTPQGQAAPRPSCVFAVFDVLSYHRCGASTKPEREYIVDASMSERYAMIQDDILGPSQERARAEYIPFPRAIRLMRKTMVKVSEIAAKIVANMAVLPPPAPSGAVPVSADFDARYFFLPTCSFNDGLIFTPDKFDVKAGSCPTQYKWKWPGKLSVDFLVQLASPPKAPRADRHNPHQQRPARHEDVSAPMADTTPAPSADDGAFVRCDVSLMFKQRGQRGQADQTGHVQMTNEYLYNPRNIDLTGGAAAAEATRAAAAAKERPGPRHKDPVIPAAKKQTVVECCLARGAASGTVRWRIDRVRHDKTDANAMITAFSVLESIAENITVADLCAGLGVELPAELSKRFPVVTSAMLGSVLPDVPALRMILRAYSNKKTGGRALPLLQWQVRLPSMQKGSLSCNHREVRQCYGLREQCPAEAFDDEGEQNASVLVGRALLELGNHGGCVGWSDTTCDVGFDATTGRWVFGGISGDAALKASTWCTNVFAHLCALAKYAVTTGGSQPEQAIIDSNRPPAATTTSTVSEPVAAAAAAPLLAPSDAHYAARTRALAAGTSRTALRRHNNWVKAVVLTTACTQAQKSAMNPNALALLDLCCGRGGDLHKFVAMPVKQVMLIDSCFEAVVEAAGRYSTNKGLSTCSVQDKGVPMTFNVSDCFNAEQTMPVVTSFVDEHEDVKSRGGFDIVSCQFSFHYAFSKESQVRGFLEIVSRSLRVGGIFAGTTVDDEALLSWRDRCGDSFGNHDFHVDFLPTDSGASEYGPAYRITVQTSVENEVEYLVEWPKFVALCAEYKLELVETKNFDAVTDTGAGLIDKLTSAGEPVDPSNGGGGGRAAPAHQKRPRAGIDVREEMTKDEKETAGLFRTVLLRKTA